MAGCLREACHDWLCAQTRESTSINAIVKAELFPTNVRALGVGLPCAIAVSVFEGIAPAFKSAGHGQRFYYYFSAMIVLSLLIYSTMRDTRHESAMHRHE